MAGGKRSRRVVLTTVLLVGEGDADVAFIKHLKTQYVPRGVGVTVTVRNAHGHGPENVLDRVIGQSRNSQFDINGALLDRDIPWTVALEEKARKQRIKLIGSIPCLEGFLLSILGIGAPEQSNDCKARLHPRLNGSPYEPRSYAKPFPKSVLDDMRVRIDELDRLLKLLEGKMPRF